MWKGKCFRTIILTAAIYFSNLSLIFINGKFVTDLFCQSQINSYSSNLMSDDLWSEVSIVAVGDVMLGSWVTPILTQKGSLYPFEATSSILKSGDATIANLEAPFTLAGEKFKKKFNFKVPPHHAPGIKDAGISVVTMANNHIMDYGESGLISTMCTLQYTGIEFCGAGLNLEQASQPAIIERKGKRIAFFGFSMTFPQEFYATEDSSGTAYPEPDSMTKSLTAWEDSVDFTVVSFHWGAEKREFPKEYQIYFAHLAVDSGADLVLGHHPHVLQGIELYKNRLIAYSLGNFVFGSYSKHAVDSIILRIYLRNDGLFYAQCIPINVNNREVEFQPRILNATRKSEVINKLQKLSLKLNNGQNIIEDSGLIFGEWGSFYDDWLQETVVNSFLNISLSKEIFIESN